MFRARSRAKDVKAIMFIKNGVDLTAEIAYNEVVLTCVLFFWISENLSVKSSIYARNFKISIEFSLRTND